MMISTFTSRYCGRQLQWHFIQDACDPHRAPDVVFSSDPSFTPLLVTAAGAVGDTAAEPGAAHQQLLELLEGWDGRNDSGSSSTDRLIGLLLQLYTAHNKQRIATCCSDERILFEASMCDALGCSEVLLTGGDGAAAGPQQAAFTLPVPVDLSPAQTLLACMQRLHQQRQPGDINNVAAAQQEFALTVTFTASSSSAPQLQLHAPGWFDAQLPHLTLPGWEAHTSLLEYQGQLAERVERHLADHCPAAVQRCSLFEELARLLGGPALELHIPGSSSSSRFTGGGSAANAPAAAGVFALQFEQQPLLLYVSLPRGYPAEPPELSLQNMRRLGGGDARMVLHSLPWSPRWSVDEQAARMFNFVKQQAAAHVVGAPPPGGDAGSAPASSGGSDGFAAAAHEGQPGFGGGASGASYL